MHGMLSLAVLVTAFAGLAGWVGYLLVRLYRACPAPRSSLAQPAAGDPEQSGAGDLEQSGAGDSLQLAAYDPEQPAAGDLQPAAGDLAASSAAENLAQSSVTGDLADQPGDPAEFSPADDLADAQAATPQPVP
jgi:predicted lipid-binding transport protein (Tim44 family)